MKTAHASMHGLLAREVNAPGEMGSNEFSRWAALIEERTGTVLPPARKSLLVTKLATRMHEIGCACHEDYFELLNSGVNGAQEWSVFVDRITTHETRFFRHVDALGLVRDLVASRLSENIAGKVAVQAWSAGCATGEEAYTLAMTIDAVLQQHPAESYFGITATDISSPALRVARKGIYHQRRMGGVGEDIRKKYFTSLEDGRYQVSRELRTRICFAHMNILDARQGLPGKMDLVYCQNMLIYFNRETRARLADRMVEHLLPDGLMILGSGELVGWRHPLMEKVDCDHTLAYRRINQQRPE